METKIRGQVTRTFPRKGYFWVRGEDGSDYWCHVSQVQNSDLMITVLSPDRILTPSVGQGCLFEPHRTDKGQGLEAKSIVLE